MEFDLDFANSGICDESSPDSLVDPLIRVNISQMKSRAEIDRELFGGPISSDESGVPEVAGSQPEVNQANISHGPEGVPGILPIPEI